MKYQDLDFEILRSQVPPYNWFYTISDGTKYYVSKIFYSTGNQVLKAVFEAMEILIDSKIDHDNVRPKLN